MGAPVLNGPFTMPMMRPFVPKKLQPWLYVLIAIGFQMSGGVYMGALSEMMSGHSLMREDIQMCLYSSLIGMTVYFPMLFRMKFRFTNKSLLTAALLVMIACNAVAPYITFLPLLWAVCFISGMAKIQGTFECMSNIQLWMTPKRDFTVFFPLLQCLILCSMQASDLLTVHLAYYFHWTYMHYFIIGYMVVALLIMTVCVRPFHFMKKRLPLYGLDILGMMLWSTFGLLVAYLFCYGEFLDWWNSETFREIVVWAAATLAFALWRMFTIRHPYYEPRMWTYRQLGLVFLLITVVEGLLAVENGMEEMVYSSVLGLEELSIVQLDWVSIAGVLLGCAFSYWWMHTRQMNYIRLISVGLISLSAYMVTFYFLISAGVYMWQMTVPVMCRTFAYAIFCCVFFVWLEEIMEFQHFFQALSVFNFLHAVVGGVIGGAIYSHAFSWLMQDNMASYGTTVDLVAVTREQLPLADFMSRFSMEMMEISIKQIYGTLAYASIILLFIFLLYDTPVRSTLKSMPSWTSVARKVKSSIWRQNHNKSTQLSLLNNDSQAV